MSRRVASTPPELPGLTFQRLLGSGGFADVFLYEQQLPKRLVAVKVLLADGLDDSARRAFVDEANVMAQLSAHPYIVTIFHADVSTDGRPFLMMEYASGPSLAERYKREPLAVPDVLRTGIRLAGAIATAHAAGILHRDIKPANVLSNDFGWPALTDFGIASTIDDELPVHTTTAGAIADTGSGTGSQSVGMSVPWSPPEMFDERPQPDARSDVFSLAATLFTLLAGRTPFEIRGRSNGVLDLIGRIERGAVSPLDRQDVPRSLVAVLAKGMASRRSERYQSAIELARALQRVELELGYAPTSIDVPNLIVHDAIEAKEDGEDPDATSFRQVPTIAAQPSAPIGSPPAARAPAAPAPADAETSLRQMPSVSPESPVIHRPDLAEAGEQTVMRPGDSLLGGVRPGAPAAPAAAPAREPGSRRGLVIGLSIAAAFVLLAGGIALSLVLGGGTRDQAGGVEPEQPGTTDPAVVPPDTAPPSPRFLGSEPRGDDRVVFTWENPEPQEGDAFLWSPAEEPDAKRTLSEPQVEVERPGPGVRVCIDVVVLRAGRTSPVPMRSCDPE
ncbi:serine/threonine-protein kinase [Homoserinibacter sp. YIM 151385]|uniref:serine/threonine-protein kinase n=1 Tax=Homoserinibacter sp. YIM 151385 TaxID=2985506 RepID=UPI0022F0F359|nr:serine/threonine-protein kinase [Homoserinibacter sp. YIM 151385]WBU39233.1 serine/threonine-protein kinase [Homoserinibacter sp. YIM 151385]